MPMSKRKRIDIEEEEYLDNANDNPQNFSNWATLLRIVFSRQAKFLKIRREHLQPVLGKVTQKGSLSIFVKHLNLELEDIFGLTLEQQGTEFALVSCLNSKSKLCLHDVFMDDLETPKGNLLGRPSKKRHPIVGNMYETCMGAVQIIVIIILVLSQNRITETDLFDTLIQFGLTNRLNLPNPILNLPLQGIITEMTRREYIARTESPTSKSNDCNIDYSLGKRALREFLPEDIQSILKEIFLQEELDDKIITALKRCFPNYNFSVNPTLENESEK